MSLAVSVCPQEAMTTTNMQVPHQPEDRRLLESRLFRNSSCSRWVFFLSTFLIRREGMELTEQTVGMLEIAGKHTRYCRI